MARMIESERMRMVVWNTAWASPRSTRGKELIRRIRHATPEFAVLTEATVPFLEALGSNHVTSNTDYGYESNGERRKVALWSSRCFSDEDPLGSPELPPGRFVAATLHGPLGPLRVLGVCIPWSHAHVTSGRRDARAWAEHLKYLEVLRPIATGLRRPTVLAGDFNQRIPRARQPKRVVEPLLPILTELNCVTEGRIPPLGRQAIDHIAVSRDLGAAGVRALDDRFGDTRISDHFGLQADLVQESRSGPIDALDPAGSGTR